jgi:hypothetical protein
MHTVTLFSTAAKRQYAVCNPSRQKGDHDALVCPSGGEFTRYAYPVVSVHHIGGR